MTLMHIEPMPLPGAPQSDETDELDFARLVGPTAWRRLAPAIRERFSAKPTAAKPIHYRGVMREVRCSRAGWLLAQACRLFGTPFALHRGSDVPVTITLRALDSGSAMVWERAYHYPDHGTAIVCSEKRVASNGTLTESVAAGFSMKLALSEADGALHFRSVGYIWRIGGWDIPLPDLLSPGDAQIVHRDLGHGRFRFTMTIRHMLFGMLFHQDGVFHEEEMTP
jgi:hypothetical protein